MPEETPVSEAPDLGIGSAPASRTSEKAKPQESGFLIPEEAQPPAPPSTQAPEVQKAGPADVFDWSKYDIRRTDPKDIPENRREEFVKVQQQVRKAQGVRNREIEDERRLNETVSTQAQRIADLERRIADLAKSPQTPAVKEEQAEQRQTIADMIQNPDLDEDTRTGLKILKGDMDERDRKWEERAKKWETAADATHSRATQEEASNLQTFFRDVTDNVEAFGYDAEGRPLVDVYQDAVLRGLGVQVQGSGADMKLVRVAAPLTNPATGQPHNMTSLLELYTGQTAKTATAMRTEDAAIRAEADLSVASPGATPPAAPGELSEEEAYATLRKSGFGKR